MTNDEALQIHQNGGSLEGVFLSRADLVEDLTLDLHPIEVKSECFRGYTALGNLRQAS